MQTIRTILYVVLVSMITGLCTSGSAQNSYLKGSLVANQLDDPSSIAYLDRSLDWSSWTETGVIGYALEYQHAMTEKISIKPRIGVRVSRLRYLR